MRSKERAVATGAREDEEFGVTLATDSARLARYARRLTGAEADAGDLL